MRAVAPSAVSSARLAEPACRRRAPHVALRRAPVPRAAVARLAEGAGASPDASASLPSKTLSDSGTLVHGVLHGDARSLLPPERTSGRALEPARVADVSRYWAMPNLRPMKDSSDGFLTFLKVSSFCILSVTLGVVVSHNAALRREAARGGRAVDVEGSDHLGYGFAYGYQYGYRYGYGYGHKYGDPEFTADRGAANVAWSDAPRAEPEPRERWSESSHPVKSVAGKLGVGLKGVWEAIPA